jgi:hypothetical protein
MRFISDPLEQTTAATDLLLVVMALACAFSLRHYRVSSPFKTGIWMLAFTTLGVASLLGAIVHGVVMSEPVKSLLWLPLNLSLGLSTALFVSGAIYDGWDHATAHSWSRYLLGMAFLFGLATLFTKQSFVIFLPLAGVGLLFALVVYSRLGVQRRPGAGITAAGIVLTLIASAVQASRVVTFTLIWPFDHRGTFHIIQFLALPLIATGVSMALQSEGAAAGRTADDVSRTVI